MDIVKTVKAVRKIVGEWKSAGLSVGLVPTMGYLHEGHASLIYRAAKECDRVIVSIFVNPTQFGPNEDLDTYPRDIERDSALCISMGVNLIYMPEISEMYPDGFSTFVEVSGLSDYLCGKSRPGHFRGVCTVVNKLFNIVRPDIAYFGQKDAQQFAILCRMVEDLNLDIKMIGCPIVREEDGLAKSSRNARLNKKERQAALILHKALTLAKHTLDSGEKNIANIKKIMQEVIKSEALAKIDYIEIVDAKSLSPTDTLSGPILVALAVYIGKVRLIDNFSYPF